jgi:hypothetical protein
MMKFGVHTWIISPCNKVFMEEGKEVLPAGNCQQKADNAEDDEASNS